MDQTSREKVLADYQWFALRVARRVCRRNITMHDDEFSVSLLALDEAIDGYCPDRGASFKHYAALVINRRLIDHLRKQQRHQHLSLDTVIEGIEGVVESTETHPAAVQEAQARHATQVEARDLAMEIQRFRQRLQEFGLDLPDLLAATPKHRDTRERLQRTARILVGRSDLYTHMLRTKRLPIRDLMSLTGFSRKVLENGRRYIIGIALVLGGEFEGMQAHLGGIGHEPPNDRDRTGN